ncbi:MAG: hypothetical protein RL669_1628 [Pseudomonadota bacterium]|nr:hypothetical protein [Burkholderiaceae bacterium]
MDAVAPRASALRVLGRALLYFVLVFGVGFLLGPIRVLWLAPQVGERSAELIEAPLMFGAILLASRWIGRRWCAGWSHRAILGVGAGAAACVLGADLAVGVGLRGMSVAQVFLARDPVGAAVYYALVVFMALAPSLWKRREAPA